MLQREALSDKTWCTRKQKQPVKNLEIPGRRGTPNYTLERKFQGGGSGGGGGVVENNLPWGVWIFSGTTQ